MLIKTLTDIQSVKRCETFEKLTHNNEGFFLFKRFIETNKEQHNSTYSTLESESLTSWSNMMDQNSTIQQ